MDLHLHLQTYNTYTVNAYDVWWCWRGGQLAIMFVYVYVYVHVFSYV